MILSFSVRMIYVCLRGCDKKLSVFSIIDQKYRSHRLDAYKLVQFRLDLRRVFVHAIMTH